MVEVHHVRRGAGEPLLLVQGLAANSRWWGEPFLTALERDFDVVAFDHRNTGESPRSDDEFMLRDLADDAVALLDRLGIERAHVLGCSMGGMVAQELVLAHRDRVRTLTLGCTFTGGEGSRNTPRETWEQLAEAMQSGDRERAFRVSFETNVSPATAADDEAYRRFYEMTSAKPTAVPVILRQVQAIAQFDVSRRIGAVTAPVLVVHGTEDRMVPVSNAAMLERLLPAARVELLEGHGHIFWFEAPERSADLVRQHALAGARGIAPGRDSGRVSA